MSFGAAGYLWLLALAPVAGAMAAGGLWWRARARVRFGGVHPRSAAAYIAPALIALAIVAASFAAARPQFGSHRAPSEDRGIDVVVVLDVSQSMLAGDAQPTRLGRAQAEIGSLLDRMHGDRVGVILFAGQPFVRTPLTADLRAVRQLIDGVDHERGLVPPGSDLGAAIRGGQRLLAAGDAQTKVMLVVSDGEDHGAGVAPAVAAARAAGYLIYTAGAGTGRGAAVLDTDPSTGQTTARRDAGGNAVITHLDTAALSGIARDGRGRYIELAGDGRPLACLSAELRALASTDFGGAQTATPIERFQVVVAIALLLVLAAAALVAGPRIAMRRAARLWPLAGVGLLVGAVCAGGVAEVNRRGNDAYDRQQFAAAGDAYHTAQAIDPARAELYHNSGNAYNQQGDFSHAIQDTQRALDLAPAGPLVPLAQYELGNHYAGAGSLQEAREAYKRALLADPRDADAKHNLEVVEARLHATPTATTTPLEQPPPAPTPPGPPASDGRGSTPAAAGASGTPSATPDAAAQGGTPVPSELDQLTAEQLQQRLNDALSGIANQFSEEEALRILDLLNRTNERTTEEHQGSGGSVSPPDY